MLIRELAAKTDVAAHTIRFYEQEGLLDHRYVTRGKNNYRNYSEAAIERIAMIKQGQAAGFTLAEVKSLLFSWDAGELNPEDQIFHIRQKVNALTETICELQAARSFLMEKLAGLEETTTVDRLSEDQPSPESSV
jgi:DNA-binding transcriptional MerR regulator